MICIVTAGPTCEPLDAVRRLTNFSTGKLGSELADYLVGQGHTVLLLKSASSTYQVGSRATEVFAFETTLELERHLHSLTDRKIGAVFHAAAVSDFKFGKIWTRSSLGQLEETKQGKLTSHEGTLVAELVPTPKLISQLRIMFPEAWLVGWKYEIDGDQESAVASARKQIVESRTNACVVNGPAYGEGFGFLTGGGDVRRLSSSSALFECLGEWLTPES